MAKRPYLDDLQTARLWAKIKALVSPLSTKVTTLEGQTQTNTADLASFTNRVRTLELKYDTNVTGNSWSVSFTSLSGAEPNDLEDTALEVGTIVNAGAGWNTFHFREPFDGVPQVALQAEDFEGVVLIKNITAEGFLYCLRVLSTGSYYTAAGTESSSAHSAATLVNGTTTTAAEVKINYLAVEYGGER